jgi:predicted Fe-S protein YdhL (DUF1289 family)
MAPSALIKSPCIQVCVLDPATGWCEGCYRSLAEIGGWMRFSAEERDRVMALLPSRRSQRAATTAQGGPR